MMPESYDMVIFFMNELRMKKTWDGRQLLSGCRATEAEVSFDPVK